MAKRSIRKRRHYEDVWYLAKGRDVRPFSTLSQLVERARSLTRYRTENRGDVWYTIGDTLMESGLIDDIVLHEGKVLDEDFEGPVLGRGVTLVRHGDRENVEQREEPDPHTPRISR